MRACLLLLLGCAAAPPLPEVPGSWPGPALPSDLEVQARRALARDAWRRDDLLREALEPGRTFAATRVAPDTALRWPSSALYGLGGALFDLTWTPALGLGGADTPGLRRFHVGSRGGPDAQRCADCHWRGGPAGGGDAADNAYLGGDGDDVRTALERNPRALLGAAVIERLAAEMTVSLHATRDALVAAARRDGRPLEAPLQAKGLSFGTLGALADGSLDLRRVRGVRGDLVVRPFGWKGHHARLIDAVTEQAALHLGVQTAAFAATAGPERAGPHGGTDPDGDEVQDELSEPQLLGLTAYVGLQEVGHQELPVLPEHLRRWAAGEGRFRDLGCAACHVASLPLDDPTWTVTTPGGLTRTFDLLVEGGEPRPVRGDDGLIRVWLFSDLRLHSLGSALSEDRPYHDVAPDFWVTPPLWGLLRSGPWLHDARAPSIEEAILAHDGEARAARDAYAALSNDARFDVRVYLSALTRAPRLVTR